MVIEVSKEIDVRRIGVDRYSLKTGCNLRTIMEVNFEVLKEPRGLIRCIQTLMAILAFSLTVGFSTDCQFNIPCGETDADDLDISYEIEYPFTSTSVSVPLDCKSNPLEYELPFDFSNGAEFFVATGVLAFLYCLAILAVYICFHQLYAQNTKLPVIDLGITTVLTIFWLAGSSAWAQGVADLKFYLHPDTVYNLMPICIQNLESRTHHCQTVEDGSYGTLNASLILGFANFLLWACSLWFIYKETVFFAEPVADVTQNQQTKPVARV